MVKLKDESGYTIIESLVSLSVLGMLIVLTATILMKVFYNPKLILRNEALLLAKNEIGNSIRYKSTIDSTYTSANGNLLIERRITLQRSLHQIEVSVKMVNSEKEIIRLSASVKNEDN